MRGGGAQDDEINKYRRGKQLFSIMILDIINSKRLDYQFKSTFFSFILQPHVVLRLQKEDE